MVFVEEKSNRFKLIWRNQYGSYGVTSRRVRVEADERLEMRGKIPSRTNKFLEESKILEFITIVS